MKKLGQRGFSHVEILIAAVVVIVVAAVGFYVFNKYQDRSSQAESAANTEPTQIDTEAASLPVMTEVQKVEAARAFTKVIDDPNIGQAFACKVNANYWDGVKYYFTGANAKKMWTTWNVHVAGGQAGAGGNSSRLERANVIKFFKPPGSAPANMVMQWRFSLKNANNNRVNSSWMVQKDLTRCP